MEDVMEKINAEEEKPDIGRRKLKTVAVPQPKISCENYMAFNGKHKHDYVCAYIKQVNKGKRLTADEWDYIYNKEVNNA